VIVITYTENGEKVSKQIHTDCVGDKYSIEIVETDENGLEANIIINHSKEGYSIGHNGILILNKDKNQIPINYE
jgi:hypothetical protein